MMKPTRDNTQTVEEEPNTNLKRNLGLGSGIALIVGTMIGSGIFISPKGVLEGTGSVGFSLVIWAACGIVSTLGALSYAELGTCIPLSGGEHAYLMYVFGRRGLSFGKLPAFLFDWVGLFILRPTMFTLMTLSLGTYTVKPFFPGCASPPELPVKLITVTAMLFLAAVNVFSVRMATHLQNLTTIVKLVALGIITVVGIYKIASGSTDYIGEGFEGTSRDPSLVAIAFYNGLWAFDGWNNLNFVTEELRNPEKDLPRAIMIGIPLTTLAYIMANVGFFAVMSKEEVLASHAVAVTWGDKMLGVMSWIMPVFVVLSCLGAANGCLFSSGRLCYAAARDQHFPTVLSYIQVQRMTPMLSIMFTTLVAICTVIPGDLSTLIDFYSFSIQLFFGITVFALIVLRFTEPKLERPYKVPIFIPVAVMMISAYLTLAPVIQTGRVTFLYASLFILSGVIVYLLLVYRRITLPHLGGIYRACQLLFQVVPADKSLQGQLIAKRHESNK